MKVDLTVTISVILGCAAVISPMLTAIINNWHDSAVRRQERREQSRKETVGYKKDVLEKYLQYASVYIQTQRSQDAYAAAYTVAYLYVPEDVRESMAKLDRLIQEYTYKEQYEAFIPVLKSVTAILQTL